ncbi:MAG: DNA-formamidopyrimidine glycosylase family protein [Polyangiales bacterium]
MPEGDTIFRTARALQKALAGQMITGFESGLPQVAGITRHTAIVGRVFEQVEARGKHVLMHLSAELVLRTHMRMHGSWHLYRPGERWQRPRHQMRIVFETAPFTAVGFLVHEAEWTTERELPRSAVGRLGPDVLAEDFDPLATAERILLSGDRQIGDVLLDQRVLAGLGNVYRSELLFLARVHPLQAAGSLSVESAAILTREAARLLRVNVGLSVTGHAVPSPPMRRTTGQPGSEERLWVYDRAGKPCRVCGTPIASALIGQHARRCYHCPTCQLLR